jgi:NarL family two-component system response regulator LiaR
MVNAIRSATAGKLTLSPEAAQSLINASVAPVPRRYNLSARELEVLSHMAKGLNNNEIADRLIVGRSTVKFHVSSILAKLGVASRTEAVALAVQEHIV